MKMGENIHVCSLIYPNTLHRAQFISDQWMNIEWAQTRPGVSFTLSSTSAEEETPRQTVHCPWCVRGTRWGTGLRGAKGPSWGVGEGVGSADAGMWSVPWVCMVPGSVGEKQRLWHKWVMGREPGSGAGPAGRRALWAPWYGLGSGAWLFNFF